MQKITSYLGAMIAVLGLGVFGASTALAAGGPAQIGANATAVAINANATANATVNATINSSSIDYLSLAYPSYSNYTSNRIDYANYNNSNYSSNYTPNYNNTYMPVTSSYVAPVRTARPVTNNIGSAPFVDYLTLGNNYPVLTSRAPASVNYLSYQQPVRNSYSYSYPSTSYGSSYYNYPSYAPIYSYGVSQWPAYTYAGRATVPSWESTYTAPTYSSYSQPVEDHSPSRDEYFYTSPDENYSPSRDEYIYY